MTGQSLATVPIPRHAGALSRLCLALVVSASSHLLLVRALAPDAPQRLHPQAAGILPVKVWIERLPATRAGSPADVEAEAPPGSGESPAAVAEATPAGPPRAAPATSSPAPQLPDPTVYTARDLDSYPRPAAPLDTSLIEDPAAGKPVTIRLELIIDERGVVNHVAVTGPGPAGFAESELRALLAATRFVPARKDDRAVKSRVLLSFSLIAKDGSR